MSKDTLNEAQQEIAETLILSSVSMKYIGISFVDPKTRGAYLCQKLIFMFSVFIICYHVFSDVVYMALIFSHSPKIEDIVPYFHTFGYGALSEFFLIESFILCPCFSFYKKNL
jgi:hypothetical protein